MPSSPASNRATASLQDPTPTGPPLLVIDRFDPAGIDGLKAVGCRVEVDPDVTADRLPARFAAADPEVVIVRSTKISGEAIRAAPRLQLIVRAGAGYDNIDVTAASELGVSVANCPGKNAIAVAELAWALILACDRRIPDQTAELRAGTWNKKEYAKARGLYGRTLGIVGLGQIGREIARRAHAFGMHVVAWSRNLTQERADEVGADLCSNIVNLAKLADVVSVSVAATDDTAKLIGEKFFAALRPGSIFVNTSRGSVVDHESLTRAAREKGIRVGLDVFAKEPAGGTGVFEDPIIHEAGVFGTHHVGASTDQAQQAIAAETVRIVQSYVVTGHVPHCVNRAEATGASALLTVRHLNRPGVLAHIFQTVRQAGINVEDMENVIYAGAKAACARIQLDREPTEDHIATIRANESILSVSVSPLRRS